MHPVAALSLALLMAPAPGPDFYTCNGKAVADITQDGKTTKDVQTLPPQVFAIDAERNEIGRALVKRREYENLCSIVPKNCAVSITPQRARLNGRKGDAAAGTTMAFDLDRKTGVAWFEMIVVTPAKRTAIRWDMVCKRRGA